MLTTMWGTVGHLLKMPFSLLVTTQVHPAVYMIEKLFVKDPWVLLNWRYMGSDASKDYPCRRRRPKCRLSREKAESGWSVSGGAEDQMVSRWLVE